MDPKSWLFVLDGACPDCGYDGSSVDAADTPPRIRAQVASYRTALGRDERVVRRRPDPTTWSALEYGCHVRDACAVLTERANLLLTHDEPTFATWDEDRAALDGRYDEQMPATVAYELAVNAGRLADTFDHVRPAAWQRSGVRSGDGARFTVDMLARYSLHELVHHLHDIHAGFEEMSR